MAPTPQPAPEGRAETQRDSPLLTRGLRGRFSDSSQHRAQVQGKRHEFYTEFPSSPEGKEFVGHGVTLITISRKAAASPPEPCRRQRRENAADKEGQTCHSAGKASGVLPTPFCLNLPQTLKGEARTDQHPQTRLRVQCVKTCLFLINVRFTGLFNC